MTITSRIDRITELSGEYRAAILPAPKSVKIELTARCNYKCSFCARSHRLRDQKEMDRALFERLLLDMRAAGVEEIGLFYLGESFMCGWLEEAVYFAKHTAGFPYVFLTTNGSLASPARVKKCMENGLDSLKFSLNYADADQFEDIAQVKRSMFDVMLANIRAAKAMRDEVEDETGHHCGLYASYIAYDGEQGERMQGMVEAMRPYLDEIYALPLYGQAGPQASPLAESGLVPIGGNTGRYDHQVPALPCWAVFQEGHITHDGKLSACCWDHNDGLTMGDLTEESFMHAWNSEKFMNLRLAHLSGDVRGTICEACIHGAA